MYTTDQLVDTLSASGKHSHLPSKVLSSIITLFLYMQRKSIYSSVYIGNVRYHLFWITSPKKKKKHHPVEMVLIEAWKHWWKKKNPLKAFRYCVTHALSCKNVLCSHVTAQQWCCSVLNRIVYTITTSIYIIVIKRESTFRNIQSWIMEMLYSNLCWWAELAAKSLLDCWREDKTIDGGRNNRLKGPIICKILFSNVF